MSPDRAGRFDFRKGMKKLQGDRALGALEPEQVEHVAQRAGDAKRPIDPPDLPSAFVGSVVRFEFARLDPDTHGATRAWLALIELPRQEVERRLALDPRVREGQV